MPCRCDFDNYTPPTRHTQPKIKTSDKVVESLREELKKLGAKYNALKAECDKVTQLLCYTCGVIKHEHFNDIWANLDNRLHDWSMKHDEWDFKRTVESLLSKYEFQLISKEAARESFINSAEIVHPLSNYHRTAFFDAVYDEASTKLKQKFAREDRIKELEAELARLKAEK